MLIIAKEPAANGSYPPLQPWAGQTPPEGYYQIKDGLDTSVFQEHSGFVILTVIRGMVTAMDPNTAALEAWQAAASAAALPARKLERIAESKAQLSDYLLCHPMQWIDGQRYAITAEKQQQLTGKIMSATLAAQTGTALQFDLERHRGGVPGLDPGKPDGPGLCHRRPGHQPCVLPTGPGGGHAGSVHPGGPGGHPGGL